MGGASNPKYKTAIQAFLKAQNPSAWDKIQKQQQRQLYVQAAEAKRQAEAKALADKIAAENANALNMQNSAAQMAGNMLTGMQRDQMSADSRNGMQTPLNAQVGGSAADASQGVVGGTPSQPASAKAAAAAPSGMIAGGMQSFGTAAPRRANMIPDAPGNGMANTNQNTPNLKFGGG